MFLENIVLAAKVSTIDIVRISARNCGFVSINGPRNLRGSGPYRRAYFCHLLGSSLSLLEVWVSWSLLAISGVRPTSDDVASNSR